jgi:hypothetical protein
MISEKGRKMDNPNAFIGKTTQPTTEEVIAVVGPTAAVWKELINWFAEQKVVDQEWKSSGKKYGWSLRLKHKKRNIVYLSPCNGCFRVAFVFGDRAISAARQIDLSKETLELLDKAPRYPEGTALRLIVKTTEDLIEIRKLAILKMEN